MVNNVKELQNGNINIKIGDIILSNIGGKLTRNTVIKDTLKNVNNTVVVRSALGIIRGINLESKLTVIRKRNDKQI